MNGNTVDLPFVQEFKSVLSELIKEPIMLSLDFDKYNHTNLDFIENIKYFLII